MKLALSSNFQLWLDWGIIIWDCPAQTSQQGTNIDPCVRLTLEHSTQGFEAFSRNCFRHEPPFQPNLYRGEYTKPLSPLHFLSTGSSQTTRRAVKS